MFPSLQRFITDSMTLNLVIFSQLLVFDDARSMKFELVISSSFSCIKNNV